MIAAVLEARGLPVERKIQLGPTNIVRAAILAGQIDLYPEYTGNGALFFHREADPAWKNAAKGYAVVERARQGRRTSSSGSTPAPANNTWVIAIRNDLPGFPAQRCLDDLAAYLAGAAPFQARRLGRIRREPGGPARLRSHLRLSSVGPTSS